jgi:hypothetical protein
MTWHKPRVRARSRERRITVIERILIAVLTAVLTLAGSVSAPGAGAADPVLEWNELAQRTVAGANPLVQSRSMAMAQLAVADAVAAVGGEHEPFALRQGAAPGASTAAATAAAAHGVLIALHPTAASSLDAAYAAALAAIPDGPARADGIGIGRAAATAVLEARATDGWNASASYTPANRPGRWIPTPPALAPPLAPQWARVKPFALASADQFRAAPPPPSDGPVYARDLREVFEIGGGASARRTPELTNAARFWIISGMQGWNPAARQVSAARRLTPAQNARTLALLNLAMADALIACWDSKFAHDTWRPVTAIHAGGYGVTADTGWLPLIATPPFPAYPSGHACAGGAARVVLERLLGPGGHTIALTSPTAPGVTFTYDTFKAIADQVDEARVVGGIHVRHDQTAGGELGRRVGEHVCRTALRPRGGKAVECGP